MVSDVTIHRDYNGSDHVPICLHLDLSKVALGDGVSGDETGKRSKSKHQSGKTSKAKARSKSHATSKAKAKDTESENEEESKDVNILPQEQARPA